MFREELEETDSTLAIQKHPMSKVWNSEVSRVNRLWESRKANQQEHWTQAVENQVNLEQVRLRLV